MTKPYWRFRNFVWTSSLALLALPAFAQPGDTVPLYRVTVVERTTKAINYQYRAEPTMIDFRGTILLPKAKGDATVESRQGRTQIDANLNGLEAPERFGREYLTYVLWAITPEGRPHNIGELVAGSSNKARITVTTDLQAFALIVTAEPYAAVRQPSNVVVAENEVRPDTIGIIKPVEAKYELLPRGTYTYNGPAAPSSGPRVSMKEYEAISQLYQAQNAINAATLANADHYAADTLARARQQLLNAQQMQDHKADSGRVVQNAREAAQTAEDARVLATERARAEQINSANAQVAAAQAEAAKAKVAQERAEEEAHEARVAATVAQVRVQNAAVAQAQAEADAARARDRERQVQVQPSSIPSAPPVTSQQDTVAHQREMRQRVLDELKAASVLPAIDTGRGIVATIPDDSFRTAELRDGVSPELVQIARAVARYPGLRVTVEGYSDTAEKRALTAERADAVRRMLVAYGLSANYVSASGFGDSRLLGPNTTEQDRKRNCRVEIVISGEPIGRLALWQQPFSLSRGSLPSGAAENK